MIELPRITPMMETVLLNLSTTPKTDFRIHLGTLGMTDKPASVRSTRGILTRLSRVGYATVEHVDGQDYWKITEAGLRHWPTEEELEGIRQRLRALVAQTVA